MIYIFLFVFGSYIIVYDELGIDQKSINLYCFRDDTCISSVNIPVLATTLQIDQNQQS